MRRGVIKSDGLINQEKKDLQRLTSALSQAGPESKSHAGAVVVQFLRDNPQYLAHPEGRAIMRQAQTEVRGSEWESVLYPPMSSPDGRRHLRDIWRLGETASPNVKVEGDDYVYVGPDKAPTILRVIRGGAGLPKGITTCSICRCHCIDLGGPATVCLGCVAEGRASVSRQPSGPEGAA